MPSRIDSYTSVAKALSATLDLLKEVWPYIGGLVMAAVVAAWAYLTQWGYIPVLLFALVAFVLGLFGLKLLRGMPPKRDATVSDDSTKPTGNVYVTSHNQSGGITAQNVHVNTPVQRVMGDNLKSGLLKAVPRNKRVVVWSSMGSQEAHVLANEIFAFLRSSGFPVFGNSAHQQMFVTPLHGIRLREEGENFNVEVGLPDGSEVR
ncbi:hypothetical protein [Bradyrhizobium manausense]|uniref:Uncharacterized protein n=1 Tax=Bradyrhizobium manausense TaxID=989370 RepID=A0A0R3D1A5_9BRAD|nr:hypothetical protein [Bradyrhizobium manausense]KRQ03498.1 hypothetical protein AOQ71_32880 [Bradyrhizobium manausense]